MFQLKFGQMIDKGNSGISFVYQNLTMVNIPDGNISQFITSQDPEGLFVSARR